MASPSTSQKLYLPHAVNSRQWRTVATAALLLFVTMMLCIATDAPSAFFPIGSTFTTDNGKQAISYGDTSMPHVWPAPEDRVAAAIAQCLLSKLPLGMPCSLCRQLLLPRLDVLHGWLTSRCFLCARVAFVLAPSRSFNKKHGLVTRSNAPIALND